MISLYSGYNYLSFDYVSVFGKLLTEYKWNIFLQKNAKKITKLNRSIIKQENQTHRICNHYESAYKNINKISDGIEYIQK